METLNTKIKQLTAKELISFCLQNEIELPYLFGEAPMEHSFTEDCSLSDLEKREIFESIGQYSLMSFEHIMDDEKRYKREAVIHFVDHQLYIKETIFHIWGDPRKWTYTEVKPEEKKVIIYIEKEEIMI